MKETILRSGINRRTLLTTLALLPALSAPPLSVFASAQTASSGPLPSWNEGAANKRSSTSCETRQTRQIRSSCLPRSALPLLIRMVYRN